MASVAATAAPTAHAQAVRPLLLALALDVACARRDRAVVGLGEGDVEGGGGGVVGGMAKKDDEEDGGAVEVG